MSGLEQRLAAGEPVDAIASEASFFVSRVDAKTDALLPTDSRLRGRVAIANARLAYARYLDRFSKDLCLADERWRALHDAGARPQLPLWASTGTKNPAYSDVHYVDKIVTPGAINTMPEATLRAFADHGDVQHTLPVAGRPTQPCAVPMRRVSTSTPLPASSSARGSARSVIPTMSCSTASRPRSGRPPRSPPPPARTGSAPEPS